MERTNAFIVEDAHHLGTSKIVLGRLRGVRGSSRNSAKANAMINSFWIFNYTVRRFREKAEECGIEVEGKGEYRASGKRCRSENIATS